MQTKETIKEMLKDYRTLNTKCKVLAATGKTTPETELFALVVKCISGLDDESRDIIEKVYMTGMSIREYGKRNYISRMTVCRRIETAAETIAECLK